MLAAKRDMTRREFHAALARRGWRQCVAWIELGEGKPSIGMVMRSRNGSPFKFNRRASLARAIREAKRYEGE